MAVSKETAGAVAAVDLGSNSFHLVVARLDRGHLHVVDRLRERVVLAEGLDDERRLDAKTQERALECLARFGQRLVGMPRGSVRAVGTSALRRARNARSFLGRAREVLGHGIEVIAGREEARLIYLGVCHSRAVDARRRLVIDIGGGSTECILGEGSEPLEADSLDLGCVTTSRKHFPGGEVTRAAMERARIAAALEFQGLATRYRSLGWQTCIGASGTILAVEAILRQTGDGSEGITAKGLARLRKQLVQARDMDALELPGLQAERRPVLPGGVAILSAAFEALDIERMLISSGALREGLLHDLLGRKRHEDVRELAIRRLAERYRVDVEQAGRVERSALALLAKVEQVDQDSDSARLLTWAARVHEIGMSISYSGYQKHGAYIAAHADLAGFSREDQALLAALVLAHRRKPAREMFAEFPPATGAMVQRLALILRLAVLLHRSRGPATPIPALRFERSKLRLRFPTGWLDKHPLTRADLEQEALHLKGLGVEMTLR